MKHFNQALGRQKMWGRRSNKWQFPYSLIGILCDLGINTILHSLKKMYTLWKKDVSMCISGSLGNGLGFHVQVKYLF